jgi:EAL domain-containing protein (putative c-di-GMP-specific phosphodiesterase class I)
MEWNVGSVIYWGTDQALFGEISKGFTRLKVQGSMIGADHARFLAAVYDSGVRALIADTKSHQLPVAALMGLLNTISRRIPVIVLHASDDAINTGKTWQPNDAGSFNDHITVLKGRNPGEIVATLEASGVGSRSRDLFNRNLPFYNPHVAINLLRKNGGLSVLAIDASPFRKIETEYGADVYRAVRDVFQTILLELWGRGGCFRTDDVVCRHSQHGNHFLVFLNRSRDAGAMPRPGVLERIADRVNRRLINAMWSEIYKPAAKKRLPDCIRTIPNVTVGFFSAMHNPCLDEGDVVSSVVETVFKSAKIQVERMENLQRELMHPLINRAELLYPNFQAIFHLAGLSKELVDRVRETESIEPLKQHLYGFESLIRVRADALESYVNEDDAIVSAKFLRPDVLFSIAKATKVGLELDQACIQHAARASRSLPGKLMVNILPRNLYFFDQLRPFFADRDNVVFEISESEGISNLDLMLEVRSKLQESNFGIAADDFGKGFAGLERIMSLRPDIIKLDRSLVDRIDVEPIKQEYVKGLVGAAKILQCTVLAEGIERWEEADVLQKMGVDLIQGFLLHKPQSVEDVLDQIDSGRPSLLQAS